MLPSTNTNMQRGDASMNADLERDPNQQIDNIEIDEENQGDEAAFVTYDISVYPSDYTLSVLQQMWEDEDILVPPFQRKFVWTQKQASLLIESLLMGLPVPQVFFFVLPDSTFLVIDGLQRIMSVVYYFSGYFGEETYQGKKTVFRLAGLSSKSPYANKTYNELSSEDRRKLKNRVLRVINVKQIGPENDDTSAYHIFERLNTGGTPLNAQEIRNCVYHGPLVDLLTKLNTDTNWRKILGKDPLDKHQKDIELILRVLAFSTRLDKYEKPMKEFLNKTMSHYRSAKFPEIEKFESVFPEVCKRIVAEFGHRPFHPHGRINASALDSIMAALVVGFDSLPHDLGDRYKQLTRSPEFLDTLSVSTSDATVVTNRHGVVRKVLLER